MDEELALKLKANPLYRQLVNTRSRLGWALTSIMLFVYYGFVLVIAFDKEALATKIGSGVITLGMPVGLFVIIFTVCITGYYVRRSNKSFDDITEQLKRETA
ncbi:DUF485 domain-containing protein [Cupriavidus necator]|uniref:DUF485 domain-containing protein n=1 Tax=Cupriavidus necator TaxID=106590 RepID=UPI0039C19F19